MRIILLSSVSFALAASIVGGCTSDFPDESTIASRLDGAIFTTLVDGTRVNENHYELKTDVYLDGGPGENAPSGAAALPAGDYYFQVTSPSGRVLLSTDDIECREFTVDDEGLISAVGNGACAHATGTDSDHGGLTVQLFPYDDTPNNGGVYKVWITPTDDYSPGDGQHGFIPRFSKTDVFKVDEEEVEPPKCPNGYLDYGEECDDGNSVDGDGCSADCKIEHKAPCCGDYVLDLGEQCDDGNTTSGDGCSATCQLEYAHCDYGHCPT